MAGRAWWSCLHPGEEEAERSSNRRGPGQDDDPREMLPPTRLQLHNLPIVNLEFMDRLNH